MEKPSNSGWSHLWLLGMGPNRASERFQSYKDSKGLSSIGHLALAILEHAPVVGGTISFLDRAISHYTSPTTAKVTSVAYSVLDVEESTTNLDSKKQVSQVDEILRDKLTLAIRENSSVGSSFYCSIDEISTTPCSYSLNFKEEVNIRKSSREDITDAHCSFDIQPKSGVDKPVEGKCYAVFDGYGGGDFAGYINGNFQKIFPSLLRQIKTNDGELDIQQAFQKFVDLMHAAAGKGEFMSSRSAALMCYVDTKTNIAHIATVGSSQAYVVRKIGNESKIIPLSYDNTWNSTKHKEAKEKIEEFQLNNQKKLDSKKDLGSFEKEKILSNEKKLGSILRHGPCFIGGIDDEFALEQIANGASTTIKSHECSYIAFPLQGNDKLILASGGLYQYTTEKQRIDACTSENISAELVNHFNNNSKRKGNLTVISVNCSS